MEAFLHQDFMSTWRYMFCPSLPTYTFPQHLVSSYLGSGKFLWILLCWEINWRKFPQISFSIPPGLVPGRISILITTLLILINISASAREKMPPSESLSLIDIWLGLCSIFVTLAIFEYAVVIRVKHHWITPPGRRDQTLKVSQYKKQNTFYAIGTT